MNWTGKAKAGYRITPRARKDLVNIADYTQARWGKQQRNRYLKGLEKRFAWLADNPFAGRPRPDIADDYLCFPHGHHVENRDSRLRSVIQIIGIPHQEMDVVGYFLPGEQDQ